MIAHIVKATDGQVDTKGITEYLKTSLRQFIYSYNIYISFFKLPLKLFDLLFEQNLLRALFAIAKPLTVTNNFTIYLNKISQSLSGYVSTSLTK